MKWEERSSHHYLTSGELKIVVHHCVGYEAKTWFVSCHTIGIDKVTLASTDIQVAKAEAIDLVGARLKKLTRDFEKIPRRSKA